MTPQDENSRKHHEMDEEADVSGGTGGNMGGDLRPRQGSQQADEKHDGAAAGQRNTKGAGNR